MATKLRLGFKFKKFFHLIRAVFPRWNFFDQVAYNFELEFKVKDASNWSPIQFYQKRQPLSLFLNTQTNMALAEVNIIEHFAKDIQDLQNKNALVHSRDIHKLVSYKLLKSLIEIKLQDYELPSSSVQFKIVARNTQESLDIYISDWIIVGST